MDPSAVLESERLILRRWKPDDCEPFSRINADPRVMEFMPGVLSRAESDRLVERIEKHFQQHGFGLYAAELCQENCFIGFIGLSIPNFKAHFTPAIEMGWRLAAEHWGKGLATEGAKLVARHAFVELGSKELVSFTVPANLRSQRVMTKLGMTHDCADDFDHPGLPPGHPLRRHLLYRLSNREF